MVNELVAMCESELESITCSSIAPHSLSVEIERTVERASRRGVRGARCMCKHHACAKKPAELVSDVRQSLREKLFRRD